MRNTLPVPPVYRRGGLVNGGTLRPEKNMAKTPSQKASNTTTDIKPKLTIITDEENNTKNLHTASASMNKITAREDTESTQEDEDPSPCLKPGSQRRSIRAPARSPAPRQSVAPRRPECERGMHSCLD